ncbi:MAG: SURF1 family protein [Pseudomonadota bacterium]|nr:SURF1 family protein [Pseudomonadota bacterium]
MGRWTAGWRRALVIVLALAGMALTFSLGRWQLARAEQKQAMQAAQAQRQRLPALNAGALAPPVQPGDARIHRHVQLQGQWLPAYTVFLDNRPMQGHSGFIVLTPLRLAHANASDADVVLVQRGWAPRNFAQRDALPPVQTPAGLVHVTGRLAERPPAVYALGQEGSGQIRQNLDIAGFQRETGLPLAALIVVQTGASSDGLRRDWPEPATGVHKHHGYAFQWFGLCALIGLLFMWFQVVRPLQQTFRH